MRDATCPRCRGPVQAPDLWSERWRCGEHGVVEPLRIYAPGDEDLLAHLAIRSQVPMWLVHPLPIGWAITAAAAAGDERTGPLAIALAFSGPCPTGGVADLVVIAEQPGIGLGSSLAGLNGTDPGPELMASTLPEAKVEAAGHPTALWSLDTDPDRAALVGEAQGHWLWFIGWPAESSYVLLEGLMLRDLRAHQLPEVDFGAPCPRLDS